MNPLAEIRLSVFASLLEVRLDQTEGFQPSYEIIVEDAKVSKRFGFSLASLLQSPFSYLANGRIERPPTGVLSTPRILSTYW